MFFLFQQSPQTEENTLKTINLPIRVIVGHYNCINLMQLKTVSVISDFKLLKKMGKTVGKRIAISNSIKQIL